MASITCPAAATHVLVVQIGSGSTVVVVVEVEVVVGIVQLFVPSIFAMPLTETEIFF